MLRDDYAAYSTVAQRLAQQSATAEVRDRCPGGRGVGSERTFVKEPLTGETEKG